MPTTLHHLDPALPYRELLSAPGRLAVDGSIVRELVYGPLRRGRSRVTWIQFPTSPRPWPSATEPCSTSRRRRPPGAISGTARHGAEAADAKAAYARGFLTLAHHVLVVTLDTGSGAVEPVGASHPRPSLPRRRNPDKQQGS